MREQTKRTEIYKRALLLAVPMMIQNGITNMVGLVDNVMVGKLGTESMTAVSIVGQLIFVFNLAIFGGISGPGIYGAQYYGQRNEEGFRHTFRIKLWICLACVIIGTLIFMTSGENLISMYLHGESAQMDAALTMHLGKEYMTIMLFTLLPFSITQVYASSLRETGYSVKPMIAGILSVIVDIVFNYLLIFGKFGMPRLEVKGAAIATLLARIVECVIVVAWAHYERRTHSFLIGIYRTMRIPKEISILMIKKGLPIFFNEFLWAGGLAALTQCYSTKGLEIVAGLTISNVICNLLNVVFVALGSAVGILSGQTLGAGKFEKAKENAFHLMWFTCFVCVGLTVILIAFSGIFPKVYDTTEQVRGYGQTFIVITALFFPIQGLLNSLYFTLRSGGKTVITVPVAAVLCLTTPLSVFVIYAIVQSLDLIKVAIGYGLIRKGIWISTIVD
jgi:putative MATE family efflux protein